MRNAWEFLNGERFWKWATLHPNLAYRILVLIIVCSTLYGLVHLIVQR
jgi:hypothetical protein